MFSKLAAQSLRAATKQPTGARFASSGSAIVKPSNWALYTSATIAVASAGLYTAQYGSLPFLEEASAMTAAEEGLHPADWPFYQKGYLHTFDHAAIRRGYAVYREVCSACHSLDRIAWRNLVGVSHTASEARAMAEEFEYDDGPNDEGEMFKRPGKLSDYMQAPYPNEEAARAGNAGAYPPDLSLMTKARHGSVDYVFSLLTGYVDPPAGVSIREGLNYNPYFPGGAIGMARVLFDGLVEYEDGTPATTTQMAKDVVTFLDWAAQPELDERHKYGLKGLTVIAALTALSLYVKRFKFGGFKSRKLVFNPPTSKHH